MQEVKKTILSGIKPTGQMHLGNLLGALLNWKNLQDQYNCFFMIADYHALTTVYEDTSSVAKDTEDLKINLLAIGLDPRKCNLFVQSDVYCHAELHLLLSMITPLPWLMRVPTYKGTIQELKEKDLNTYGFLGYPLLQSADILIYQADFVPVGKDQIPHLELTREIARRFNSMFNPVFKEPMELLTSNTSLNGTDGRKMSKSYNNTINVFETEASLNQKIKSMITDPQKIRKDDPGHPEICNVFAYHKIFNQANELNIKQECLAGNRGCVMCKQECAEALLAFLSPFWQKKEELLKNPQLVKEVYAEGAKKARETAEATLKIVKNSFLKA